MKHLYCFAFVLLISFGCSSSAVKKADQPATKNSPDYQFSYTPYETLEVSEKPLYNYLFNIVRNKLIYFVDQTFPTYPELIGVMIELDNNGHIGSTAGFETVMKKTYWRGWNIYDSDVIPMESGEIESYNSGKPVERLSLTPKALFYLNVKENSATAYIRYWMLQYRNYDFKYVFEKKENWKIVDTIEIR